jgi:hypothetical protein
VPFQFSGVDPLVHGVFWETMVRFPFFTHE